MVFGVVQEGLTNVLRHAAAASAVVRLDRSPGRVTVLTVEDDGRGSPQRGEHDEGMGLRGMRDRVEELGGELTAGPRPTGGFAGAGGAAAVNETPANDVPITVAVIDDQELVRMGLRTLISSEAGLELVGEAADGRAGLRLIRVGAAAGRASATSGCPRSTGSPCCVRSPPTHRCPTFGSVMLTTFELDEYVFEALRNGASGFLLKDTDPAALLDAVRIAGGRRLPARAQRDPQGDRAVRHDRPRGVPLTHSWTGSPSGSARSWRGWRAAGPTRRSPRSLVVSPDTVRTHVSRAMVSLHARDRAQLVVFAMESGLPACLPPG